MVGDHVDVYGKKSFGVFGLRYLFCIFLNKKITSVLYFCHTVFPGVLLGKKTSATVKISNSLISVLLHNVEDS